MIRDLRLDGADGNELETVVVKLIDLQARLDLMQDFVRPDQALLEAARIGIEVGGLVDLLLHKLFRGQSKEAINDIADDTFGLLIDLHLKQSGAPDDWLDVGWTIPDVSLVPALHWCAAMDVSAQWPSGNITFDALLASQREWLADTTTPPAPVPPRSRPTLYIVK
jgi:hypothetical protein